MGPTSVRAVEELFPPPVTCTGPCTPGGQMGMAGVRTRGSLSAFEGAAPLTLWLWVNCCTSPCQFLPSEAGAPWRSCVGCLT